MEKRKGVSKLIVAILLLMILMIYIVTSVELYKAGEPERARQYYNQLINESLQRKSQAPNRTCCKKIWQKVGRKKCSTNKPPQSAGLKREKRK